MEQKNIYQRILKVQEAVPYLQRDMQIQTFKTISHDAVSSAIRKSMRENGIFARATTLPESSVEKLEKGYRAIVTVQVDYINADNPNDRFSVTMPAAGDDFSDKFFGKAISKAVKYCHLKTFMIETGESEESRIEQKAIITEEEAEAFHARLALLDRPEEDFMNWASKYTKSPIKSFEDVLKTDKALVDSLLRKVEDKIKKEGQDENH